MNDETINTMGERGEAVAESGHGMIRRLHARGVPVRKRKKTSHCWISFKELPVTEDQIESAECIKCRAVYKCDSITGTCSILRHHDTCYSSSNVVSPQSSTRSSKFRYEKFSELLIEAIVQHDLPFSFVEYEGIRAVFQYISPSLKLPWRNTVKAHVLKLFDSEKLKL
ncbi:putative transcription factor/ chromatin remodeling BED-type(Zn) family [Rosa chinensis]|uniref:Putative transcription factor/ chromatin remodeling BED-type(Zn) family n=1 Tax=Rosa chinensis TaxID=74649 RepID=A0A2P6RCU2_ROSCH|nr:putative transcription factor/ chromatin remodeling BED-type(Zn) family [Rosa chinensis]